MPEPSPSKPAVLIAAISGRALAAAARRAGYRPLVADLFCDGDTVQLAESCTLLDGSLAEGIDGDTLPERLRTLAAGNDVHALVCGSGFESRPELLDRLAAHFPLRGCTGEAVRRIKDPFLFADCCARHGIPHPPIQQELPLDPESWIVKKAGAAGGSHVRRATDARAAPATRHDKADLKTTIDHPSQPHSMREDDTTTSRTYFQRMVEGHGVSVLFLADGKTAHLVGFSRQWSAPSEHAPYRYGGAVRLGRVRGEKRERIAGWLSALTVSAGLMGLCSADFIVGRDGFQLLEINPRPGATMDIFDDGDMPLFEAHLRAASGVAVTPPRYRGSMASMIVYTDCTIGSFPSIRWPDWAADRQLEGTLLAPGDPVCTVLATAPDASSARRDVRRRARQITHTWKGAEYERRFGMPE